MERKKRLQISLPPPQTNLKKLHELPVMGNENEHAAAKTHCIYHTLKSHPVPLGHVTFQNATVNDSVVHGGSQKEGWIPNT